MELLTRDSFQFLRSEHRNLWKGKGFPRGKSEPETDGKVSAYSNYRNYKTLWNYLPAILSSSSSSMTTQPSPNLLSPTYANEDILVTLSPTGSKLPPGLPTTTATWWLSISRCRKWTGLPSFPSSARLIPKFRSSFLPASVIMKSKCTLLDRKSVV